MTRERSFLYAKTKQDNRIFNLPFFSGNFLLFIAYLFIQKKLAIFIDYHLSYFSTNGLYEVARKINSIG